MKNKPENNIKMHSCVSKETMIGYINDTLDKRSFLNVSAHLEDCEYCSEAFNGLKQLSDFSALNSLPLLWKKKTGIKMTASDSFSKIILGVTTLAIIISGILFFNYKTNEIKKRNQLNKQANYPADLKTNIKEEERYNEIKINNNENTSIESYKNSAHELPVEIKNSREEIPDKIPGKEIFVLNEKYSPAMNISANHSPAFSEIRYLENLKTINYSKRYAKASLQLDVILNNVVPQYENKEQQDKKQSEALKTVYARSYENVLSNGLRNYNKGLYHEAIKDFDIISNQFSNDLNCKFYTALCFENTGKFQEAEKLFSETMKDEDDSFFEEAKWHLAMSKIKSDEIAEAKNILKEIVFDNGFYKSQAEETLKELK